MWCPVCGKRVQALKPDIAAVVIGVGTRLIYKLVESGGLHFTENQDGTILICDNSLLQPDLLNC